MTRDQIIAIAKECGDYGNNLDGPYHEFKPDELIRFAERIHIAAYERAAQVCVSLQATADEQTYPGEERAGYVLAARYAENEIRALKPKQVDK